MSLLPCPECGAKISSNATVCPYCGFVGQNPQLPICQQDTYEVLPTFQYDIIDWNPNDTLPDIALEDNRILLQYFCSWQNIKLKLPAIAEVIQSLADKENVLIAKIDPFIKKLIEKGIYRFSIDKSGEILPTIRDSEGIAKLVRLENMSFAPDMVRSLNNLSTQAATARILDELEYVEDAIRGIHIELQNDRIAMAESIKDKLLQAKKIQDARLKAMAILNILNSATDAKRVLMRNFIENLRFIKANSQKGDWQLIFEGKKGKEMPQKVADAFQALISITNIVKMECQGYAIIGELDAGKECLVQFKNFISVNSLDKKDTLLLLNENTSQDRMRIVDEFASIVSKISALDNISSIGLCSTGLLEGKEDDNK